jgi:hypothetical protein
MGCRLRERSQVSPLDHFFSVQIHSNWAFRKPNPRAPRGLLPASQIPGTMSAHADAGAGGRRRGTLAKVALSSVSAAMAEASTYPLDAVKTRLQLHRNPGGAPGRGVIRVAAELVRDGGVYRGFSPAVLRHLIYTPLRIVGYEHLRSTLASEGREVGLSEKALAGGLSGVAAQVKF